jgi:hypothetical protein
MSVLASKVSSDVMDVQVLDAELIVRLLSHRFRTLGVVSTAFAGNTNAT